MATLPPKKATHRRPSMKGAVQQDTVRGVERTRVWPSPKLSNQTPAQLEQQAWFREANWAFKYQDARIITAWAKATHRTSLYARDLFTMAAAGNLFMINSRGDRQIVPQNTINAVSQSLDILGQGENMILWRGPDRWQADYAANAGFMGQMQGCRCSRASNVTGNWTTLATLAWDGADNFDTGGYHSPSVNNDRIIPGADCKYVELTAGVMITSLASGATVNVYIRQNGNIIARTEALTGSQTFLGVNVNTGPIKLATPGTDYFDVTLFITGDTSVTVNAIDSTFFAMRVLQKVAP